MEVGILGYIYMGVRDASPHFLVYRGGCGSWCIWGWGSCGIWGGWAGCKSTFSGVYGGVGILGYRACVARSCAVLHSTPTHQYRICCTRTMSTICSILHCKYICAHRHMFIKLRGPVSICPQLPVPARRHSAKHASTQAKQAHNNIATYMSGSGTVLPSCMMHCKSW